MAGSLQHVRDKLVYSCDGRACTGQSSGDQSGATVSSPNLVHGLPGVVDLWGVLLSGVVPLPVEICACGIGPQMPSPCAVWVHVWYLCPTQHGHVICGAGFCSHSTCGRQSAKNAEKPGRWRGAHDVEDGLLQAFPGYRIVSVQYSVQEPLHEPLCTATLPRQLFPSLS